MTNNLDNMTRVERFNHYISKNSDWNCNDVLTDGKWSITREWIVGSDGKRVTGTTVYGLYYDDGGDYPLFETLGAAKKCLEKMK